MWEPTTPVAWWDQPSAACCLPASALAAFSCSAWHSKPSRYAAFRVRYRGTALVGLAPVLARVAEGLRPAVSDRRLTGTLVVTMIYNVFAWPFTSMIPVIGQNQLGLGAEGIGILTSMDGIGAFCGALLLTLFLRPAWYARAYLGGVVTYMVMLVVFALVPWPRIAGSASCC